VGKQFWRVCLGAAIAALSLATSVVSVAQGVTAVPKLDLASYMGSYYEIARLPNKLEKKCFSDVMVLYALGNHKRAFQIGTSCQLKDGTPDEYDNTGKQDKALDGKLKLSRLIFLSTPYWVLATGPNYDWALVGSPNHKSLWILSRSAKLDPETLTEIKSKATAEGFDLSKLITVVQHH